MAENGSVVLARFSNINTTVTTQHNVWLNETRDVEIPEGNLTCPRYGVVPFCRVPFS